MLLFGIAAGAFVCFVVWAGAATFLALAWALGSEELAALVAAMTIAWCFFFVTWDGKS